MFYEVIPKGKVEALTYDYDNSLSVGQIVVVPVGKRSVPGLVVKKVAQPNFKTKKILKVLYSKPLPSHLVATIKFIHDYYAEASGQAVAMILPNGVEKQRRKRKTEHLFGNDGTSNEMAQQFSSFSGHIQLNTAQKNALQGLSKAPGATKLLFGVTGSGKTNVYLTEAAKTLRAQMSVILLVPEIALTGQLVQVFEQTFGERVIVIHSRQTEAERHLIFERILESDEPCIVVGPRSALFAPLSNLGLIIIDEEHESTYYQENSPKYSAIRVASFMAKKLDIPCILGSATPDITDYYLAKNKDSLIVMSQKAKKSAIKPEIQLVDFKNRDSFSKNRYFSNYLLKSIRDNLNNGRQTLIFHNRRGSSPLTVCDNCGEELVCPNCFLPLTLHADTYTLVCHTCGHEESVPSCCPKCGALGLVHKGFGTKLLETEARKLFPKARVMRFDADNKKGESLDAVYDTVKEGGVDILIGTQTLAKGLDLPKLATVGVAQADAGLSLPDYSAEERTFQLLTQVIGRVGRGHVDKAEVIVQTFRPEHPVLRYALNEDYQGFADYLLKKRRKGMFPPFCYVAKLEITLKTEAIVVKKVRELSARLMRDKRLIVSPPMPAFHERTVKGYTWQIVVRSRSRVALIEACDGIDKNFRISLDPPGLL